MAAVGIETGDFTREDVDLACALYPGREMPDEGIFPIPSVDHNIMMPARLEDAA